MPCRSSFRLTRRAAVGFAAVSLLATPAVAQEVIKVGLVAALSGQSAKSGEAITRGLQIAIDEINAAGGVLGKKIELIRRDDESNPAKGLVAARELVQREKVAIFFGGIDTPVSAVDELVDYAMVAQATKRGAKKPGLMLINNPWGESNEAGLKAALAAAGMPSAGVEKFGNDDVDMVPQLTRLKENGADALFLVANVQPAAQITKALDRMGWTVPVVSHWGPAGGRFTELGGARAETVDMVQTFSFSGKLSPTGDKVLAALKARYPDVKTLADVTPAVGIANAYDAMHLAALAMAKAGSTSGPAMRTAFYDIGPYAGLIKTYTKPFTPESHDALSKDDYIFTRFKGPEIVPLTD